jgi:hypothetical protein
MCSSPSSPSLDAGCAGKHSIGARPAKPQRPTGDERLEEAARPLATSGCSRRSTGGRVADSRTAANVSRERNEPGWPRPDLCEFRCCCVCLMANASARLAPRWEVLMPNGREALRRWKQVSDQPMARTAPEIRLDRWRQVSCFVAVAFLLSYDWRLSSANNNNNNPSRHAAAGRIRFINNIKGARTICTTAVVIEVPVRYDDP